MVVIYGAFIGGFVGGFVANTMFWLVSKLKKEICPTCGSNKIKVIDKIRNIKTCEQCGYNSIAACIELEKQEQAPPELPAIPTPPIPPAPELIEPPAPKPIEPPTPPAPEVPIEPAAVIKKQEPDKFICKYCESVFATENRLRRHIGMKHLDKLDI